MKADTPPRSAPSRRWLDRSSEWSWPVSLSVPAGLYLRYRCSPLCEWMSRLRGTSYAKSMDVDREFFGAFFVAHGIRRVFDIGANVGDKSAVFSEHADSVLCVEADPMIARGLRSRFVFRKKVTVTNVAVGAAVGTATLFRKNHSGFSTLSEKWSQAVLAQGVFDNGSVDVPVTTLDLLMDACGRSCIRGTPCLSHRAMVLGTFCSKDAS